MNHLDFCNWLGGVMDAHTADGRDVADLPVAVVSLVNDKLYEVLNPVKSIEELYPGMQRGGVMATNYDSVNTKAGNQGHETKLELRDPFLGNTEIKGKSNV